MSHSQAQFIGFWICFLFVGDRKTQFFCVKNGKNNETVIIINTVYTKLVALTSRLYTNLVALTICVGKKNNQRIYRKQQQQVIIVLLKKQGHGKTNTQQQKKQEQPKRELFEKWKRRNEWMT